MRRRLTRREKRSRRKKAIILSTLCLLFVMTAGYAAFQTNLNITAKGNIKEKSRVIQSWTGTSNEDFHTDYYRENIVSVTFLDNNEVPENATDSWNVSADKKHGGVMAWVIPTAEDSTKYDLYIGAKDGIIANENSGFLFFYFVNLTSIQFNDNFDTSNAISINQMFYHCTKLNTLDLSSFDTENVTSMHSVFDGCRNLLTLDLSSFNTSNVVIMNAMFYGCSKLNSVNLTSFKTDKVVDMGWMFYDCNNLNSINLCNFNTDNIKIMNEMFAYTPKLQQVYVNSNWITAQADTSNMFYNSGISNVTIGQC